MSCLFNLEDKQLTRLYAIILKFSFMFRSQQDEEKKQQKHFLKEILKHPME